MLLDKERLAKEADRINAQNMKLLNSLVEYFGESVPVFMDAVSEDELPNDQMTYVFIESGNYNVTDSKNKDMTDTVTVTYFSEGRENPTLDRLAIVYLLKDARLKFQGSSQDTMFFDESDRLVGVFVATATRQVLKGCL